MSEEDVNVVRSFLDAGVRQDWPQVAELVDPDGVELESETAAVFTLREGRVTRMQGFMDRAAEKAAGLAEPS